MNRVQADHIKGSENAAKNEPKGYCMQLGSNYCKNECQNKCYDRFQNQIDQLFANLTMDKSSNEET